MNRKKKEKSQTSRTIQYFLSTIARIKPAIYFLYLAEIVLNTLKPLIITIMPKFIIDELMGGRDVSSLILYVAIAILGNELCGLFLNIVGSKKANYKDELSRHFDVLLSEKTMNVDFHFTESAGLLNSLEQAKNGMKYAGGPTAIIDCCSAVITGLLLMVESVFIFLTGSGWIILIAFVAVVLHTILTILINNVQMQYFQKRSSFDRSFAYILWQLSNYRFGKEIRLYNAQNMMLDKADYYNGQLALQMKEESNAELKFVASDMVVSLLQIAFIYIYLGVLVINKKISLGDFSMYISAGTNFMTGIQDAFYNFQMIFNKCYYLNEFVTVMNYPNKMDTGTQKVSEQKEHTIEFRNVYYKYTGTDKYALENVSVKINAGEHVSIVGMNGAGKTTFIKLLCRLYDVEQGEILLDGINIKDYDYKEYTKLFSVIFQDFKLFSFSIKENIVCTDENVNIEGVEEQIRKVGLFDKVNSLGNGLDTNLFKDFDQEGIEPSGGEQQKLAIARAIYRNAPIVVLDEPTAALDPIAEMEIYTQFEQLVGNRTALYISHRLSSCKFCDRIIVFKDGKIVEDGSHNELVKIDGGEYSAMFETQALYYQ